MSKQELFVNSLRKLINEELKRLDERAPDSWSEEAFDEDDGWNRDFFKEIGLMDVLSNAENLSYEIENARRGSYFLGGEGVDDVIEACKELIEDLTVIIEDLESFED